MISFGDNSFIKYTYSATGEKLGVEYGVRLQPVLSPTGQDATMSENGDADGTMRDRSGGFDPGTLVPIAMDGITYCGNVVYDGNDARLLTDEGYVTFTATGTPQYHYYLRDHLGNIRVVMGQTGALEQVNHYYAFGGLMRESTNPGVQPYKFGGKELDRTSGLDAYDFGARMYFADRMQWGTMDPLCEKYYDVSPYGYCHNNPVGLTDMNGMDDWYDQKGTFLRRDSKESDNIVIQRWEINVDYENYTLKVMSGNYIQNTYLTAEAYSNIFTDILSKMDDVNIEDLHNGSVSTMIFEDTKNWYNVTDSYNDAFYNSEDYAVIGNYENKQNITAYIYKDRPLHKEMFSTISNVQNLLGVHEYLGHYKNVLLHDSTPDKIVELQKSHPSWQTTTPNFKKHFETFYE